MFQKRVRAIKDRQTLADYLKDLLTNFHLRFAYELELLRSQQQVTQAQAEANLILYAFGLPSCPHLF